MERLIKSLWFLSLIGTFGLLMFVFAGLPDLVEFTDGHTTTRDFFFYSSVIILGLSNFSLYGISSRFNNQSSQMAMVIYGWLFGFNLFLNTFYSAVLMFVKMVNSGESLQYDYYGYFIYISLGLIVLSILSLPLFIAKNINKQ